ncbi:MAG: glycosyltransferase family 4 protein [Candidatus Schekmanbacteria bacterium]|nr:glycosyltransferase family 4 protein [Candidatus Schekmanbacteria bacterium]
MKDNTKIHVLHTISVSNLTGAAQPVLVLAKALSLRNEIRLSVASPVSHGNIFMRFNDEGLKVIQEIDLSPRGVFPISLLQAIKLSRIIDAEKIDIVHCHLSHDHWVSFIASAISKRKPRIVRTIHNTRLTAKRFDYRLLYGKMAKKIICISEKHRNAVIGNFNIEPGNVGVIRSSVELNRFNPEKNAEEIENFRNKFLISEDDRIIGFVARFKKGRGHTEIVEAFRKIKESVPDSKLMLVGKGELLQEIKSLVKRTLMGRSVIFTGYLKEELPSAYKVMSAAVVLAEGNDGSMRTVLEAMACGTPVIALNTGAASEIIENGVSGYVADDIGQMENRIAEVLKAQSLSRQMGEKARIRAMKLFSPGREADEHIELYKKLI